MQITSYKMRGARSRVDVAHPPIHAGTKINRAIVSRSVHVVCESALISRFRYALSRSLRAPILCFHASIDRPATRACDKFKCTYTLFPLLVSTRRAYCSASRAATNGSARNIAKPRNALNQISIGEHESIFIALSSYHAVLSLMIDYRRNKNLS